MNGFQQDILSKISALPPTVNPFDYLDQLLVEQISPRRPKSFEVQLWVCMAAHGICGILVLGSLVVRIFRKSFWLVHFKSKNPKLWTPHFTAGWSIWAVILVIFLELAVYNAKALGNGLQPKFAYWWTFAWVPAWLGGFSAAWAITVSLLLHLYNSGNDNQFVEFIAPIINVLSLIVPIVYLAIIIPIALTCSNHYETTIREIDKIRDFLHSSALSYDGHFSPLDLAPLLPITQRVQQAYAGFNKWLRTTFAFYAGTAVLLVILLATVATLYVKLLRRALNEIGDCATLREDNLVHRKVMEKTYNNLVITLVCFTILGSIFGGISLYIAIDPGSLLSRTTAEAVSLIAFWSFALFGLPTAILLFIRSFDRTAFSSDSPTTSLSRPSLMIRGRPHSHLPSLSLTFRRKLSFGSNSVKSPLQIDDESDKFTSLPRGFEIVLSPSKSSPVDSRPPTLGGDSIRDDSSEYPPSRPTLPYYHPSNTRYSYASTTNVLNVSTSARATLSELTSSPKEKEFGILEEKARTEEISEGERDRTGSVFCATSRIN
ncbi:hypothetical protein JCM3765_004756 [Sporobolomyces pararoseus]